jgi:hypothetical protein
VSSLGAAARLAEAVAQISGLDGVLTTLTDGRLTVRLTRGIFRLEERHVERARTRQPCLHRGVAGRHPPTPSALTKNVYRFRDTPPGLRSVRPVRPHCR